MSASVSLPLHHKVQEFSSGTGSPGWSRKKGRKTVMVCGVELQAKSVVSTLDNGIIMSNKAAVIQTVVHALGRGAGISSTPLPVVFAGSSSLCLVESSSRVAVRSS